LVCKKLFLLRAGSGSSGSTSSSLSSSDFVQHSSRRTKKTPTLDSTLAMDANSSVIGTSYQQIPEPGSAARTQIGSSQSSTPGQSPRHSRKGSTTNGGGGSGLTHSASTSSIPPARPGLIDNTCLIMPTSGGKVTSLTVEGGKLRPSAKIGKDMVFVPERLWRALVQWYGGSTALPRQVIR
jgi:hypothetical protein